MLVGVQLDTLVVLYCSQLVCEVKTMVYDWDGEEMVSWCVESVAQVVQMDQFKRNSDVIDVRSMFWWV